MAVSFTCYGFGNKFLGRYKTYFDPSDLPAGKSAVINGCFLDSDGKAPNKIHFVVSGTSK